MSYFLILDVGTTNIKAYAFSSDGELVDKVEQKTKPKYPKSGWIEQDPLYVIDTIHKLINKIQGKNGKSYGIGFTNQRSSSIIWDKKTGEPLYNMITWQDTRTIELTEQLSKKFIIKFGKSLGKFVKGFSGLIPSIKKTRKGAYLVTLANIGFGTAHSSMHIRWMLDNISEVKKAVEAKDAIFGNIDSWVAWNLTGKHVTDYTNASSTGLFDPFYAKWSKNITNIVEIPPYLLPEIITNDIQIGIVKDYDIPLLTQIADQHASLYMAGVEKGSLSITNGTGAFIDINTGIQPCPGYTGIYPMVAISTKDKIFYQLEGAVNSLGSAIDWLLSIGFIKDYNEISDAFLKAKKETGTIFIPPFSGLNSPYLRPDIKAAIFNITLDSNKSDFIKSLITGIAMRSSEVILALEKVSNIAVEKVISDGGASKSNEYMQLLADLSGKQILRAKNLNGSAYGTFMLARLIYQKKDIIKSWSPPDIDRVFKPQEDHSNFKLEWNKRIEELLD